MIEGSLEEMASMEQQERKIIPLTLKGVDIDNTQHRKIISEKDHQDTEQVHHL